MDEVRKQKSFLTTEELVRIITWAQAHKDDVKNQPIMVLQKMFEKAGDVPYVSVSRVRQIAKTICPDRKDRIMPKEMKKMTLKHLEGRVAKLEYFIHYLLKTEELAMLEEEYAKSRRTS